VVRACSHVCDDGNTFADFSIAIRLNPNELDTHRIHSK
jgi:hypothetical protein